MNNFSNSKNIKSCTPADPGLSSFFRNSLTPAIRVVLSIILLFSTIETEAAKIVTTVYPTDDIVIADYDVTDYGADNTGVNDATESIQNAINDCYNAGGGTVWMPAGTYKVTNTIYIKSFVTLRGDWRDPDSSGVDYGTVISAQVASGISGPVLFQIGGSAGAMGLTVYYPDQSASDPVPYNYTFNLGAWSGQPGTYMANNLINCTMLNSYLGVGKSAIDNTEVHECGTFRNIKGTVLYRGIVAYNSADVDTWSHINLNNSYWADAGVVYNAPSLDTLNKWTRDSCIAYTFGDLEWDQFYDLNGSDYNIGINIVDGSRVTFCGEFLYSNITNTNIAVKADVLDSRWGVSFLRCVLDGSTASIQNNSEGYVKVTDCTLSGSTSGTVQTNSPGTSLPSYSECDSIPKVTAAVLYDVTKAPYNAPYTIPQSGLPTLDATPSIQSALNDAGNNGGGVVYLPAGWYKIDSHLIVPANVELRGCSSVPQLDQSDLSYGTTLMGYEGYNTSTPERDTAMITLNGNNAGISGLRFFYPDNNPTNGVKPYPFTIRGNGSKLYITNIGLTGVYNAVDFSTNQCDDHFLRNVSGAIYNKGIVVGESTHGWIEDCLTNPAKADRCVYGVTDWISEGNIFTKVINPVTKVYEKHIIVNNASDEQIMNCFSYGSNTGLWIQSGKADCYNFGTDNVGLYTIRVDCGSDTANVMNVMRYNGTTSTGTLTVYNEMYLSNNKNPKVTSPAITSTPVLSASEGIPYCYVITTTGSPAPCITAIGAPSWLTFSNDTLSGTPPSTGDFGPITITATNSVCPSATQTFSLNCINAVTEYDSHDQINVYPNPGGDKLTIESKNALPQTYNVSIADTKGAVLFKMKINICSKYTLDVSDFTNGLYFMTLQNEKEHYVNKIVIQK